MLRKHLAILLLLSWIVPSGFDLAQELYFPGQAEIHNEQAFLPGSGHLFANNFIESTDSLSCRQSIHPEDPAPEVSLRIPADRSKTSKLYKLHGVFLI
jgi:hypothetical protein